MYKRVRTRIYYVKHYPARRTMFKVKEKSDCIKRRQLLLKNNLIENENTTLQLQLLRKDCLLLLFM